MIDTLCNARNTWTQTTLNEFCGERGQSIAPGKTPDSKFELYSVPSFPTRRPEIVAGKKVGSNKQLVASDSVLLCKINPRINRAWVVGDFSRHTKIASTEWIVFPPDERVEPKFLSYFLQQNIVRDFLAANVSGVGGSLMRVKPSTLRDFPFAYPDRDRQHSIVAEIEKQFSRLDEAVVSLKRTKANLKRYKAAVLKAAVEGKLTEDWRKQHPNVEPASKLLERILAERRAKWNGKGKYKEPNEPDTSDLPDIPDRWGWATMPQLGELNRGKSKHRPRNDPKLFGGPYPFIQTGDVKHSGRFVRSHSQTYNKSGLAQSRLWPAGTLCITIAANIAETGILTYPACFPDSVVGFVFDSDPVTVRFIDLFVRTEREEIARFAPATAQKNINLEILSQVAVPFPPLEEQKEIVAEVERRLSVIDELEIAIEANLTRADRLRQAILQQAFSGKLVPCEGRDDATPGPILSVAAEAPAMYRTGR